MPRIGLFSDTHGFLHSDLLPELQECDEVWHAGDVGSLEILSSMNGLKKIRAVFGNIDDPAIRQQLPEDLVFELGGAQILLSHIIGHPKGLHRRARTLLRETDPDLVIYGHSHILRLDYAEKSRTLFINPGAMGNHGLHLLRTAMIFTLDNRTLTDFEILEFGNRGAEPAGVTKRVRMHDWTLRS